MTDEETIRALTSEIAGLQGENMGLHVTAGFFEHRCGLLEKLLRSEALSQEEKESLQGCCPLVHPPHVVCRACGLTLEDYTRAAAKLRLVP